MRKTVGGARITTTNLKMSGNHPKLSIAHVLTPDRFYAIPSRYFGRKYKLVHMQITLCTHNQHDEQARGNNFLLIPRLFHTWVMTATFPDLAPYFQKARHATKTTYSILSSTLDKGLFFSTNSTKGGCDPSTVTPSFQEPNPHVVCPFRGTKCSCELQIFLPVLAALSWPTHWRNQNEA